MSSHGSAISSQNTEPLEPRPLELSLNPIDGSLLTAPLTQVLLATTDALYQDLYNMAHGELDVTTAAQLDADASAQQEEENPAAVEKALTRRERMSNLSFAQRRHELAWRLAQHSRALQHVAGLTATDASSEFSKQVQLSSTALQHARTAWVQADEAQDAMYFFHARLFPARAAPHDVYGAADVHLAGKWYDLPADLRLASDRYDTVKDSEFSRTEIDERWQMAVRDKLLGGEVAWMKRQGIRQEFDLSLSGGILKLTNGAPRRIGTSHEMSHPIQALLTVVSSSEIDAWTLLSLDLRVEAKTGEFNHQLEASNRQRFDLHRLAVLAMSREEARVRKLKAEAAASAAAKKEAEETETDYGGDSEEFVARPLHALFQVAQSFSLSWQLELLSAQAQALRRGAWSAGEGNQINVTPIQVPDENNENNLLGALSISFWRVDDAYGPPSLDDLVVEDSFEDANGRVREPLNLRKFVDSTNQLVLLIRAEKAVGVRVALSGGSAIRQSTDVQTKETVGQLLIALSNPVALSASDALLAATKLCAERKCDAAVRALQQLPSNLLPPWIGLKAERANVSVAVRPSYHGISSSSSSSSSQEMPILFRLACDARTGSFAPTFPRSMNLLRYLACNDIKATESVALRIANAPANRRRAAGSKSTGRLVKEAFDGLVRSMNALGQRVGVGGCWNDKDDQSASIRDRSIAVACRDVITSLTKCCGLAVLFGLTPIALGTALGMNGKPDMAGEAPMEKVDGIQLFHIPPLSVILEQQLKESTKTASDGVTTKRSYLQQRLFGVSFACTDEALTLYPLDIAVLLDSPSNTPVQKSCSIIPFRAGREDDVIGAPDPKRRKYDENGESGTGNQLVDVTSVLPQFAALLAATIDDLRQPNVFPES